MVAAPVAIDEADEAADSGPWVAAAGAELESLI